MKGPTVHSVLGNILGKRKIKRCPGKNMAYDAVEKKAKSLGGTVEQFGMNWGWITNISTKQKADELVSWLENNGFDHRGVYGRDENKYSVRYR